jgi:hypothetical protein
VDVFDEDTTLICLIRTAPALTTNTLVRLHTIQNCTMHTHTHTQKKKKKKKKKKNAQVWSHPWREHFEPGRAYELRQDCSYANGTDALEIAFDVTPRAGVRQFGSVRD